MNMIRVFLAAAVAALLALPANAGMNNPTSVNGTANQISCAPNFGKAVCALTPNVQVATSLAVGGCSIGTNAFCVTGTASISGATTVGGNLNMGGGNFAVGASNIIAWMASRGILSSPAANTIQIGNLDSGAPSAQVLQFQNGSGTNIAAASQGTIIAPLGTGTGTNGDLVIQTGTKTTSGTGVATKTTALVVKAETQLAQLYGPLSSIGTIPTVSGTGSPTITTGSTDTAGEVTGGASATSIVITFATAKTNAPFCVVTPQTQVASFAYTLSTTAITITQTATTGQKIDYHCMQR